MKNIQIVILLGAIVLSSCKSHMVEVVKQATEKTEIVLTKLWETDTLLKTCEAVRYNANKNVIYVSNIEGVPTNEKDGDGTISILNLEGKILNKNWVTGLNAPKGLHFFKDKLYAADINEVVKIDIETGKIDKKYVVEKAVFLNDLDIDKNGDIYFTDSRDSKVYKLSNDKVSLWLDMEGLNPNGIYVEKERILVVSFSKGDLIAIDKKTKERSVMAIGILSGDGIVAINSGYLVSAWTGELYFVDKNLPGAEATKILDTKNDKLNTADIGIIPEKNILIVPTFYGNKVVAYKIN